MLVPREPRIVTECAVDFEVLGTTVHARSEDISRHGTYVRTQRSLPAGEVVDLRITLPDGRSVEVVARVAHALTATAARAIGRSPGVGFEFVERCPAELRALLDELARTASSMHGDPDEGHVFVAARTAALVDRLASALGHSGLSVTPHSNGAEAHARIQADRPDALVTEPELDGMDGWSLLSTLSTHPVLADLPVVFVAADDCDMARLRAYRLGVADYIQPPFTDEELVLRVRRAMGLDGGRARTGLRGRLEDLGLPTLLSLLEFERKSGRVELLGDGEAARLLVAEGRILRVEAPGDGGPIEKVHAILEWSRGAFEFSPCEVVGTDEVGLDTQELLLEAARLADHARRDPADADAHDRGATASRADPPSPPPVDGPA